MHDPGEDAVETRGEVLLVLPREGDQQVRLILDHWQSWRFASLRTWWQSAEDGLWRPTRKGLTIRAQELPAVIEGLIQIAERLDVNPEGGPSAPDGLATAEGAQMPD